MTNPPPDVDLQDLADALARFWALDVGELHYVPEGFGSYHWVTGTPPPMYFLTVDDLDAKPWLGGDRDSTFDGLEAAYETALALERQAHLDFVVAPVPQLDGAAALRLGDRYTLTVFPFVEGHPGRWGEPITRSHRVQLLRQLAELHRSAPGRTLRTPRHGVAIPGRAALEAALDDLALPWSGGPFSEPARQALTRHASSVREWLGRFDLLAERVESAGPEVVVTHGEPHPGNLILTDDGVLLADWDTVGLAPPERDLWMLDDGSPDALQPYVEASGRSVDDTATSLFGLAWTLTEIAAFTELFRSQHATDQDTRRSWRVLTDSLSGAGSPSPYGARPS